tara:strand:- start:65 stop:583 length:519 start_codon:yes stop_codon:yes gene_type:complete
MAYYGKDIDRDTFNKMQTATREAPDRMFKEDRVFTESPYNTTYDDLARYGADKHSFQILEQLFEEDKTKNASVKNWDFDRYLENISNSRLEELFLGERREGDPSFYGKAGDLLRDTYADDIDQLKLSAYNFYASKGDRGAQIDRSNVSVKAPRGGKTWDKERMLDERTPKQY